MNHVSHFLSVGRVSKNEQDVRSLSKNEQDVRSFLVLRYNELAVLEDQSFISYYNELVTKHGHRYVDQYLIPYLIKHYEFDINSRLREERAEIVNKKVMQILS